MTEALPTDPTSDPCEKCGAPVYGYVEQRCCDGRECGCMGRPLEPCWCTKCWDDWEASRPKRGFLGSTPWGEIDDSP